MPNLVIQSAQIQCSFGTTPASLSVLPTNRVQSGTPAATVQAHQPTVNIPPFGMCTTTTNPQVAAATSAAQGVLTPQPCLPVTTAPWTPGSPTVRIGGQPALNNTCTCMCQWGGQITITNAGQSSVHVP